MTGLLQHIAFISMPGGGEWIILLVVGLLIFGRRLPDVARSLGKSVNEFKKGMREFQESADEVVRDVNKATSDVASEVNNATDMNDYGYQDPNTSIDYTSQQASSDPASDADPYGNTEPPATTEDVVETGDSGAEDVPANQDKQVPPVEPMK